MFWPICCLILSIIVFIVCIALYVIFSDDHGFLVTILVVISIVGIFFAAGNFDDKREEKTISIEEPSVTVYDNKRIVDLNKVNEEVILSMCKYRKIEYSMLGKIVLYLSTNINIFAQTILRSIYF